MKRCSTANVGDVLAVDRQHSGLGENPVIVRVYIYIFYYVGCVGGLLQFFFFLPLSPYQLFTLIPFTPFFTYRQIANIRANSFKSLPVQWI